MKKSFLKQNKFAILLLVVALIASVVGVTYAAYTNSQYAQRTIAVYDAGGDRFSSNYLNDGASKDNVRTVFVTDSAISPMTVVTICNYQQGKQTRPYNEDIDYTFTARLVKYDAENPAKYVPVNAAYITDNSLGAYSVSVKKGSESPVTLNGSNLSQNFSGSLEADTSLSDAFTVTFSANFTESQPNLYLEIVADPGDLSLPTISGIFKTGLRVAGASNAWIGEFSDDDSIYDPDDYDGLNYRISGVGAGTFTLKWNDSLVQISEVSLEELLAIDGVTQSGNSLTFPVDSGDCPRYDIQFYKVDIAGREWADMNELLSSGSAALPAGKAVGYFFTTS